MKKLAAKITLKGKCYKFITLINVKFCSKNVNYSAMNFGSNQIGHQSGNFGNLSNPFLSRSLVRSLVPFIEV